MDKPWKKARQEELEALAGKDGLSKDQIMELCRLLQPDWSDEQIEDHIRKEFGYLINPGICIKSNYKALSYIQNGKYPYSANIPINTNPKLEDELKVFAKHVILATDWKLLQGTLIHRANNTPFSHCWLEATMADGERSAFDFTDAEEERHCFHIDTWNEACQVPPQKYPEAWEAFKDADYVRREYTWERAQRKHKQHKGKFEFWFPVPPFESKMFD
jgi:hypothetical protein